MAVVGSVPDATPDVRQPALSYPSSSSSSLVLLLAGSPGRVLQCLILSHFSAHRRLHGPRPRPITLTHQRRGLSISSLSLQSIPSQSQSKSHLLNVPAAADAGGAGGMSSYSVTLGVSGKGAGEEGLGAWPCPSSPPSLHWKKKHCWHTSLRLMVVLYLLHSVRGYFS